RYFAYLMPVIGFLGTAWGIGRAVGFISDSLPSLEDLPSFIGSLGGATDELQTAFDTTLLALVYAGAMTLVLTIVSQRGQELVARLDELVNDQLLGLFRERNPSVVAVATGFGQMIDK